MGGEGVRGVRGGMWLGPVAGMLVHADLVNSHTAV